MSTLAQPRSTAGVLWLGKVDPVGVDATPEAAEAFARRVTLAPADTAGAVRRLPVLLQALYDQIGDAERAWGWAVRVTHAAWPVFENLVRQGDEEAVLFSGAASRARFLLYSAPFRSPEKGLQHDVATILARTDLPLRELAWQAQRAREDWLRHLLRHEQDHGLLLMERRSAAGILEPSAVQTTLAAATSGAAALFPGRPGDPPTSLRLVVPGDPPELDPYLPAVAEQLVRQLLLPRFDLVASYRVLRAAGSRRLTTGTVTWLLLLVVAAVIPWVSLAGLGKLEDEVRVAASMAPYCAMLVLAVAVHPSAVHVSCLRLPAGALLGLAVFLPFIDGPLDAAGGAVPAGAAGLLVAYGYLLVEARSHGVPAVAALWRVARVVVLGLLHAVAVTAAVLTGVMPVLSSTWAGVGAEALHATVWLGASAGLVIGVVLQVLWEDRPITYPLAHLEWTGERP